MIMLIEQTVRKELRRNEEMIRQYERLISELPKGSLVCKKTGYYYLKYRKDGKVLDEYIGKDPENIAVLREKLIERKHCEEMLRALRGEQKAISKILEGFA